MAVSTPGRALSAEEHAHAMADYINEGTARALALGNRGPLKRSAAGTLDSDILDAYWEHGFYVFENVVDEAELAELRADVERMLDIAPTDPNSNRDTLGRPAFGGAFERPPYRFAKPLSDPLGGTTKNKGRHPAKMHEATPSKDAPAYTVQNLHGNLQLMDSTLCLYGHPGLLAVAEAVLGPDFVPYNEVTFIKEPGLGPSVAWHQDGTTHWDGADWDHGAHGFNFMTQLYPSTAANCVWILPGSHKLGKVDIRQMMKDAGSDRIEGSMPLLCESGDAFILNRQVVHGSFANTSTERRVTINAGFFPRKQVQDMTVEHLDGRVVTFDDDHIHERSRMIAIGIDARRQRFPDERPYCYQPLAGETEKNRWNEMTRQSVVKNYNLRDMYI
jgi:ectoine hydroxylase-related dioxygenase (phytanoyl-CoA dioxygenase family)